ncbi:unnamed protein product [marine sediment metagenome]|uniref:Uncharacterized protein n=1 Tax=marine sediment metagenome TaxID=412755 RepID=X1KSV5_9ZZZZ
MRLKWAVALLFESVVIMVLGEVPEPLLVAQKFPHGNPGYWYYSLLLPFTEYGDEAALTIDIIDFDIHQFRLDVTTNNWAFCDF